MDSITFDGLTRTLSSTTTRRSALHGLFAAATAALVGGALLRGDDASARRRRKKHRNGGSQTALLRPGDRCQHSSQCVSPYICKVAFNASNSDRTCCGGQGAGCGATNDDGDFTAPFCCAGFTCVFHDSDATWTCEAVPDEI